jgi:hypothetical protein
MKRHDALRLVTKLFVFVWIAVCSQRLWAGVLDQNYPVVPDAFGAEVSSVINRAQTFTVGITGKLDRLELELFRGANPTAPLVAEFRKTLADGSPDVSAAGLLATAAFDTSLIPTTFFTTDFTGVNLGSQAFSVTKGQLLAICMTSATTSSSTTDYYWATADSAANPRYPNGQAFFRLAGSSYSPASTQDSSFRTFVAVPEPSSLLLLFGGVALYITVRKR